MAGRVTCSACGGDNAGDQRFCGSCGASLSQACPSCGSDNPAGFRFCGGCGSALQTTSPRREPSEERRWATVVFGDLSGFTKTSERMDPEDVRTLVDRCMDKLGEISTIYEGHVERVTGDEIMVVFGAPVAHEDDPERAVRTALEMQRCAGEEAAEFGDLALRIGVNTGEVMYAPVGPGDARQQTVMGDVVNTASRLESAAPLGGVLVGKATYEATKHAISYDEVEPVVAKGKEQPVPAWLALRAVAEPAARRLSEAPIVGRGSELELITQIWEAVVTERRPRLVTVIGPPGIGKSKLARRFTSTLGGSRAVWGRCLPYGERAGGAFGQIVRQVAGTYVTDEAGVSRDRLDDVVREVLGAHDDGLVEHLATILGVGSGDETDPRDLFAAARRFLEALAVDTPTVLVFEDLQWADTGLLELIQWLAHHTQDASVLFLALTRPELLDTHPSWGGGLAGYTALSLGPLSDAHAAELARQLRPDLGTDALARIHAAGGGNPLFVEELVAWISEAGDRGATLPSSITSMVAARLDRLPPHLRTIVLDASVVGTSFWSGTLEAIGGDPTEALDELVARDLIRREASSRVPGEDEYAFRHQLIRDVAYSILPKAARLERHAAVARYIEQRVGENVPLIAGVLAHHWEEAGETETAADYLIEAADLALQGWEQEKAVELLKQARSLIAPDDISRKRDINLKLAVARTRRMHMVFDYKHSTSRDPD